MCNEEAQMNKVSHSFASVYFSVFYRTWWIGSDSCLTPFLKSSDVVCAAVSVDTEDLSLLPGAEPILSHSLLLQQPGVLQFDWAGNEAHLTALLHQAPDPPVVIVLLQT